MKKRYGREVGSLNTHVYVCVCVNVRVTGVLCRCEVVNRRRHGRRKNETGKTRRGPYVPRVKSVSVLSYLVSKVPLQLL